MRRTAPRTIVELACCMVNDSRCMFFSGRRLLLDEGCDWGIPRFGEGMTRNACGLAVVACCWTRAAMTRYDGGNLAAFSSFFFYPE